MTFLTLLGGGGAPQTPAPFLLLLLLLLRGRFLTASMATLFALGGCSVSLRASIPRVPANAVDFSARATVESEMAQAGVVTVEGKAGGQTGAMADAMVSGGGRSEVFVEVTDGATSTDEPTAVGASAGGASMNEAVSGSQPQSWTDEGQSERAGDASSEVAAESAAGASAETSVGVSVRLSMQAEAAEAAPEALDGRNGVRAVGGGRGQLRALATDVGVSVDGFRTRLAELEPLAEAAAEGDAATTFAVGGSVRVSTAFEVDPHDPDMGRVVMRVRGERPADANARIRVHLVIDRSSSMQRAWGDVMSAARTLVQTLDPRDEVHIVAYDANAEEVYPLGPVGDGRAVIGALGEISVGGGTNIEAGLGQAYAVARRHQRASLTTRVILLSDGVPNGGAFTAAGLAPMASRARAEGHLTTTIGLGDSFDADVLRAVAQAGAGGYHVALDPEALAPALREEVIGARAVAAMRVRARLVLPSGVALADGVDPSTLSPEVIGFRAGEERRFSVRVRVRSAAPIAVRVTVDTGAGAVSGQGSVAARNGLATRRVEADLALADALDTAAAHVNNGRTQEAAGALRAHADQWEGVRGDARLTVRVGAVLRVASAIASLTPRASHTDRRRMALTMGGMSVRLRR